jgi:D-sedoheptulose 7-phosphate isomerase
MCGNGGSAAESDHGVGEGLGTFRRRDRKPLRWFDLTASRASIMAIGNDFGFEKIFVRQLEAFAKPGDVVIGMSTSGSSENVLAAMRWAQPKNIVTIGLTGLDGAPINQFASICIRAPFNNKEPDRDTDFIQEVHLMIIHYWFAELDATDW